MTGRSVKRRSNLAMLVTLRKGNNSSEALMKRAAEGLCSEKRGTPSSGPMRKQTYSVRP